LKNCLLAALALLYICSLGRAGFGLDPDEPRYASIGREMARSGDWITPHLYGTPWFEKPPLLYWMTAVATRIGFHDEWAARLPVALLSLTFLAFFYSVLEREFSRRVALIATAILGTSAGWLGYSYAAVTDLPMSACLGSAMLVTLFDRRDLFNMRRSNSSGRTAGWIAGVLLGFAILAKAFLPVALFFPVWLIARGKRATIVAGAILVAAPWHLLVSLRNGAAFWDVYFWQQQVGRFNSTALQHGQPFWFYIPVLLLGLFPWTPLFALLARGKTFDDVRVSSLAIWLAVALVFLSVFTNKLPGYLLSLLPAVAIVLAVALDRAPYQEWWMAACAVLLTLLPTAMAALPEALLAGATKASWTFHRGGLVFLIVAGAVWWLASNRQTGLAVLAAALSAAVGIGVLEARVFPVLDQRVSARQFWRDHRDQIPSACLDPGLRRASEYALDYYASRALPQCGPEARGYRVVAAPEGLALLQPQHDAP
jgi:4-amino-4-deoxy-L-arabinose transferase-like glycosyltransferase